MARQRHLNGRVAGGRRQTDSQPLAQPGHRTVGTDAGDQADAEIVPVPILQDTNARPAHLRRPFQEQHASTGFGHEAGRSQSADSAPDDHDVPATLGRIARRGRRPLSRRSLRPVRRRQI
jgi:hypothetical protein